jgi:hypothetical protein
MHTALVIHTAAPTLGARLLIRWVAGAPTRMAVLLKTQVETTADTPVEITADTPVEIAADTPVQHTLEAQDLLGGSRSQL